MDWHLGESRRVFIYWRRWCSTHVIGITRARGVHHPGVHRAAHFAPAACPTARFAPSRIERCLSIAHPCAQNLGAAASTKFWKRDAARVYAACLLTFATHHILATCRSRRIDRIGSPKIRRCRPAASVTRRPSPFLRLDGWPGKLRDRTM
jgi:hypothetical protein